MNFSVNQNRQFYVAATADDFKKNAVDGSFYFLTKNALNEYLRSDIVKANLLKSVSVTTPSDAVKMKQAKVVFSGTPDTATTYVMRIVLRQYFGMGDDTDYIKDIAIRPSSSTVSIFYTELAAAATKAFAREIDTPLAFDAQSTYLQITANEPDWHLGTMKFMPLNFEVYLVPVYDSSYNEVDWGKVAYNGSTTFTDGTAFSTVSGFTAPTGVAPTYKNSQMIADLEYFCKGEIGDQYRGVDWPNIIPTEYMVNARSTNGYYVMDIHYAYRGDGMENQDSEKTITIVTEAVTAGATLFKAFLADLKDVNENVIINATAEAEKAFSGDSDKTDSVIDSPAS